MDIKLAVGATVSFIWAVISTIANFIASHKEIIQSIVLRVQKDTADGTWTPEEKEQEAIDIYNQQIKPKLPVQIKIILMVIPDSVIEKWIRRMIENICKKSAEVKLTA